MAETVTVTKPAPILEGSLTAFLSQIDKLGGGALDPRLDPSKFTTVTDPDTGKKTQIFRGIDTSKYDPKVAQHVALQTDAAKAAAPIGIAMTMIGLVTGALWGQPMWGTWWEWDPKLTSFLILFLFYLGYIILWAAVEDPDTAADLTSVLCIVGSVFAVLSRYATNFWNQGLHQDASLSIDKEEHVADVFYYPLIVVMAGFVLLFVALVLLNTRSEIMKRRAGVIMARSRI